MSNRPAPSGNVSVSRPAELGFSMPAEWEKHEATWLVWPTNDITWPEAHMEKVRQSYLLMMQELLEAEKVYLLIAKEEYGERAMKELKLRGAKISNLVLHHRPVVDGWVRDYGPTYLKDRAGNRAACKWTFNAWGGKYDDLLSDNLIFQDSQLAGARLFEAGIVLEGGSIEVNGAGICMTSEQCLLNKNRNPSLSRREIEDVLKACLGVESVLWLEDGIVGDDTDGHIDDIARFISEETITAAYEDNENDPNHPILKKNWELLEKWQKEKSSRRIVKLPMPSPVLAEDEPLPASYANFYIANGLVLLPVFDDPKDREAAAVLRDLFPGRKIVPVPCRDVVYGMGTIHCLSQQVPL